MLGILSLLGLGSSPRCSQHSRASGRSERWAPHTPEFLVFLVCLLVAQVSSAEFCLSPENAAPAQCFPVECSSARSQALREPPSCGFPFQYLSCTLHGRGSSLLPRTLLHHPWHRQDPTSATFPKAGKGPSQRNVGRGRGTPVAARASRARARAFTWRGWGGRRSPRWPQAPFPHLMQHL